MLKNILKVMSLKRYLKQDYEKKRNDCIGKLIRIDIIMLPECDEH
jgi:hypothetical protein